MSHIHPFLAWKNGFVEGKITQVFVLHLKRSFLSSQSAFIEEMKRFFHSETKQKQCTKIQKGRYKKSCSGYGQCLSCLLSLS